MIGAHLDLATLEFALVGEGDLEGDARRRAWLHLGGGCPFCCGALEEVGAKESVSECLSEPTADPLRAALRRWVLARQGQPPHSPRITPIHLYWLERSRREGGCLARLAIEEARLAVREDREGAITSFERLVEALADPALLALGVERWQGLRTVAHAYLGHVLLRTQARTRGLALLQHADQALALVGPNPEVRATVLLVRAEVDGELGEHSSSLAVLRGVEAQLERLAEAVWSPGHWATLRRLQGAGEQRLSRPREAVDRLSEALHLTPAACEAFRVSIASRLCLLQLEAGEIEHAQRCWEIVDASPALLGPGELMHRSVEVDFELLSGRFAEAEEAQRQILSESIATKDRTAGFHALDGIVGSLLLDGETKAIRSLRGELEAVEALPKLGEDPVRPRGMSPLVFDAEAAQQPERRVS